MSAHSLNRVIISIALAGCGVVASAPAPAKSKVTAQNVIAVSGVVSGDVQQVGFRAMIQKQAIENNLAGSAKNNDDKTVQFSLQGDKNRVNRALAVIRDGTKKSSNVKVAVSKAAADPDLNTFAVVGWTSLSRDIKNPYDLVFTLRADNTTIAVSSPKCNSAA
jgi:acylphosphatase